MKLAKTIERLNADLAAFAERTESDAATLYEDANTSFRLKNITLHKRSNNINFPYVLEYEYDFLDGRGLNLEHDEHLCEDEVRDYVKFWRACLRRAIRYWEMDAIELDALQDGETEETEED